MQNCKRLNRSGDFNRVKRPGTAYDVSVLVPENKDVLSSTISVRLTLKMSTHKKIKFKDEYLKLATVGVCYTKAIIQLKSPTKFIRRNSNDKLFNII